MEADLELSFFKLHAAKNDFVLIAADQLNTPLRFDQLALAIADRHAGVGFDQLMVLTKDRRASSGLGYLVYNADGSQAQQCGNGARALADWLCRHRALVPPFQLQAPTALIDVITDEALGLGVQLQRPQFAPNQLPLNREVEQLQYPIHILGLDLQFSALSLGNPHITFCVEDLDKANVEAIGSALQRHEDFPEKVNVGFCQVINRQEINLRVFERGAGETFACGSGACAAVINMIRLGHCDRGVHVRMPGGELAVAWPSDDAAVQLFGPVLEVFQGRMLIQAKWLRA
jgi:diaminopimelate epimerase